jgi:hypothetical protein
MVDQTCPMIVYRLLDPRHKSYMVTTDPKTTSCGGCVAFLVRGRNCWLDDQR